MLCTEKKDFLMDMLKKRKTDFLEPKYFSEAFIIKIIPTNAIFFLPLNCAWDLQFAPSIQVLNL